MELPFEPRMSDPMDEFEKMTEQPAWPDPDLFADPLCHSLDALEASIEGQHFMISHLPDPLSNMLDKLEDETVQQGNLPAISGQVLPTQDFAGEHIPQGAGGPESTAPPIPATEETPTTKQYSMPVPGMRGRSGNRSRNTKDGDGHYCHLHKAWVLPEDCENCGDFEQDEYTSEDEEKRCKHSIFQFSEDSDN